MTFNTCFMPFPFSHLFAGVSDASSRSRAIVEMITTVDPDVVCLQELFAPFESHALLQCLQKHYPHIRSEFKTHFFAIGNGMAILSKYPCSEIAYHPFTPCEGMNRTIERGFISFKVNNGEETLAHITTTHLQSEHNATAFQVRAHEIEQIIDHIEQRRAQYNSTFPYLLIGDLNVSWGSDEYWNSLLPQLFIDGYTKTLCSVDRESCTCTEYLIDYYRGCVDDTLLTRMTHTTHRFPRNRYIEILDYCLLHKDDAIRYDISTKRVEAFDFTHPNSAISDHHALISWVRSR